MTDAPVLILTGGRIRTMAAGPPFARDLALRGGRGMALG